MCNVSVLLGVSLSLSSGHHAGPGLSGVAGGLEATKPGGVVALVAATVVVLVTNVDVRKAGSSLNVRCQKLHGDYKLCHTFDQSFTVYTKIS